MVDVVQEDDRTWFRAQATGNNEAEIAIYDEIGLFGVSAKDFRDELRALGAVSTIILSINSPGGSVFDGLAIYNMLRRHKAKVIVTIDGIASSIASVVAMAGDRVLMPENAMMMIHDPMGVAIGGAKDLRELAAALDKIKNSLVSAYVNKSGADRDEIVRLMADETWFDAEEAVDLGLADEIEQPVRMAATFDLGRRFAKVPTDLLRSRQEDQMTGTNPQNPGQQGASPAQAQGSAGTTNSGGTAAAPATGQQPATQQQPAAPAAQQPAQPAATASAGADAETIRAEERKRAADIMSACSMVGKGDLAGQFIAEGKSLSDVVAALQQQRASGSGGTDGGTTTATGGAGEINARNGNAGGQGKGALRVDLTADMRRRAGMKEGA